MTLAPLRDRELVVALMGVAAVVYALTPPIPVYLDAFVPLANAFLQGQLHTPDAPSWLSELVARPGGGWYVPYPPGPALSVLPGVMLLGTGFDQGIAAAIYGALNVGLMWLLLERIDVPPFQRFWLVIAFGFGTVHWWAAGTGDAWQYAQVVAVTALLVALNLGVARRAPFAAGIALGLAAASRLPVGLTLPLFLALYAGVGFPPRLSEIDRGRMLAVGRLLAGVAIPAALVALYNWARFGSFTDFGYTRIPNVLNEPWYSSGILSLEYIPRHLHAIFVRGFDFVDQFPWFRPNWYGTSLVLTAPILLWLVKARSREPLVVYSWIAVALALAPIVTHGAVGFSQWSYRFILDVAPILFLLLGIVFRRGLTVEARVAIALGLMVNAYGIWAVTIANFVSY